MTKTIHSRQSQYVRETLIELRVTAGLTQRQLAAKLNREHSFVGRVDLGERRVDIVELFWICKACGANPAAVARKLMKHFEKIQSGQDGSA